jgi:hypothetical protein
MTNKYFDFSIQITATRRPPVEVFDPASFKLAPLYRSGTDIENM